jgi:hypothetical protein
MSFLQAQFYPQTITETVFEVLPRVRDSINGINFLERLWAYLTIRDLLEKVAKGQLNSCVVVEEKKAKRSISLGQNIFTGKSSFKNYRMKGHKCTVFLHTSPLVKPETEGSEKTP